MPLRAALCIALLAAPGARAGPAGCEALLSRLQKACLASCAAQSAADRKAGLPERYARCAATCQETGKAKLESLQARHAQQQKESCGQSCAKRHPGQCPAESDYARCYAQCRAKEKEGTKAQRRPSRSGGSANTTAT
jgi:hypothetical protein